MWTANRDVPVVEHVRAILRALDRKLEAAATDHLLEALVQAYAGPALIVAPAFDQTARAALERLHGDGIAIALVSNTMRTPGFVLRTLLDRAGLLRYFAHTAFSDEVGIRKPAPEIFRQALQALGVEPASALHVGDDEVLDVAGAHAAGMRTVQVVSDGDQASSPDADRTITRLGDLPAAVASLEMD